MARANAIKALRAAGKVSRGTSVLLYGPPKGGKSALAAQLAEHRELIWFDIENGSEVLFNEQVVNPKFLENIELIQIPDYKKDPVAIEYMMKAFQGEKMSICDKHGRNLCPRCRQDSEATSTKVDLFALDPNKHIVVLDSMTQATRSAAALITKKQLAGNDSKFEFDHWRLQNVYIDVLMDMCQAGKFNVVVITHEQGIEQTDGTEKITPSGSTKTYARTVAKNFDSVVYVHQIGTSHKFSAQTSESPKAVTGTRANVDVATDGLIALFDPSKRTVQPTKPEPSKGKVAKRSLLTKK